VPLGVWVQLLLDHSSKPRGRREVASMLSPEDGPVQALSDPCAWMSNLLFGRISFCTRFATCPLRWRRVALALSGPELLSRCLSRLSGFEREELRSLPLERPPSAPCASARSAQTHGGDAQSRDRSGPDDQSHEELLQCRPGQVCPGSLVHTGLRCHPFKGAAEHRLFRPPPIDGRPGRASLIGEATEPREPPEPSQ